VIRRRRSRRARRHEHIHRRHFLSVHPERFAYHAAQAIAGDGIPGCADADGHAESRLFRVIVDTLDDEKRIRVPLAPLPRAIELGGGVEFLTGLQSVTPGRNFTRQRFSVTARRLRPLARRRFRTWRPFFVAMRARNPCVRLRLILLGW
jgi:hypothetical protein